MSFYDGRTDRASLHGVTRPERLYSRYSSRCTSTHSEDPDTTPPRKLKLPRWKMEILHGGIKKFFGTLICFFRSFISFFRTFISALRGEFSFPHWRFPISYRGERCEAGDASEQVCHYRLQLVRFAPARNERYLKSCLYICHYY